MKGPRDLGIKSKNNKLLKVIREYQNLILILLIVLSALYYNYDNGGVLYSLINDDVDSLILFLNSFGFMGIIVFFIIVVIEVIVAPIPSVILYAAGGILFGTFWGGTAALLANILGALHLRLRKHMGENM